MTAMFAAANRRPKPQAVTTAAPSPGSAVFRGEAKQWRDRAVMRAYRAGLSELLIGHIFALADAYVAELVRGRGLRTPHRRETGTGCDNRVEHGFTGPVSRRCGCGTVFRAETWRDFWCAACLEQSPHLRRNAGT
jgi:hypothetical protein